MWKFVKSGISENCELFGVNIFDSEWESSEETASAYDSQYHKAFHFNVYNANIGNRIVEFAAGEFSNSVYGFYVRETGSEGLQSRF